jgi:AraC-like DNA-binding protein
VGYSWFRKIFKNYTGMAPGQYLIQLKIEKSKELLCDTSKSIKEIAYELKFDNNFYFSKQFKEKTGLTPAQFRKKSRSE